MNFSTKLLDWYHQHGRHDLPWQKKPTPYRVWISEIMLQQTQVNTVIPYYQRFIQSFPSLKVLALADINDVLSHWSGLGYYARARNLHKTAQIIYSYHHGCFPKSVDALAKLPGIGRSTAGAIASFAMKLPATILDGNVKRVLTRYYAIAGWPEKTTVNQKLWELAKNNTPQKDTHFFNQAMMDLGATICIKNNPKCSFCPLSRECQAHLQSRETEFPTRKKRKSPKPIKSIYTLLLEREAGCLLLEKRPPTGIWGGLWAFPECAIDKDIKYYCQKRFMLEIKGQCYWKPIIHQFSHFSLEIKPLLIDVFLSSKSVMDSDSLIWYKLGQALPGGIAAPVKQLLRQYGESDESHYFL